MDDVSHYIHCHVHTVFCYSVANLVGQNRETFEVAQRPRGEGQGGCVPLPGQELFLKLARKERILAILRALIFLVRHYAMLTLDDCDYNGSHIMYNKQHVFPLLTAILYVTNSAKSEGRGDTENPVKKKKIILPTFMRTNFGYLSQPWREFRIIFPSFLNMEGIFLLH